MEKYALAIHGGAGTILRSMMTPEKEANYIKALEDAILAGEQILKDGGIATDAVEAAIISLEDNSLFNAGKGSVFTHDGKNEMDASIMYGKNLKAGSVAGISNIKNPIRLSRAVMDKSEHVILTGQGAMSFAEKINAEFAPDEYFFIEARYEQLQVAKANDSIILDHTIIPGIEIAPEQQTENEKKFGTVGAVALDIYGDLAAGTSTGGMTNKKYGRVGDSSIIGAGTYANNTTCAISCTGHGEYFIRSVVAYDISCLIEYKGLSLQQACDLVVHDKLVKIGGEGGLIALDRFGNIEMPFNSEGMYRAMRKSDSEIYIGIYK